jgi:ABC-type taurine transport system substrate-binding protein
MKLSQLASKPQLIKVSLDDEEIVQEYGEGLDFWIYDRQDMDTFVKMATLDSSQFDKITEIVNKMMLDEDGSQINKDGLTLPTPIMMKAIQKVVETLGKSQKQITQNLTKR